MRKIVPVLMIGVMVLGGCVTHDEMTGPNGERMVATQCDGIALHYSSCIKKIAKLCPNGYQIVGGDKTQGTVGSTNSGWNASGGGNAYGWGASGSGWGNGFMAPYISREVIAICK